MLVRKCDICDHIIGDETGYMMDIFKVFMPRGVELRSKTKITSMEICSECKEAIFDVMNERLSIHALCAKAKENKNE